MALALLIGWGAAPARAAEPSPSPAARAALTPAQVQETLAILQDDRRRAELVGSLTAIARALPAPDAATPAAAEPAPSPLTDDGLARRLLAEAAAALRKAGADLVSTIEALNGLPDLAAWLRAELADPRARARIASALWHVAIVLGGALTAERAAIWLLRRPRAALTQRAARLAGPDEPEDLRVADPAAADGSERLVPRTRLAGALHLVRRLPLALAQVLIDLLPVAAFLTSGALLLGGAPPDFAAVAGTSATAALEAYAFGRVVLCLLRLLVAPHHPRLRLVHLSDGGARFVMRLARWVVGLGATGYAVSQVGLALGMHTAARNAFVKLFVLLIVLVLIGAVLRCRRAVALRLRAPAGDDGMLAALRDRLAEVWHLVAIGLLAAGWLIWAVEVQGGIARLAGFLLTTSAVLVGAWLIGILLLGGLEKLAHGGPDTEPSARASAYYPLARRLVVGLVALLAAFALLQAWGFDPLAWFARGSLGGQVVSALALVLLTVLLAAAAWAAANAGVDRYLARASRESDGARAARLRTILPFLRTMLLSAILLVAGLAVLSEVGINVAPLLAGAGVIGIAVGFGSQTLVKDVITGLFLLLENAMQVGDKVTVAGMAGVVEALSIRTIRLRASDGSIFVIPFSAVTTVNNASRDFAFAAVGVGVAYGEDTDRVGEVLKEIVAALRSDPPFRDQILGDLNLWGVDELGNFAVTIKGEVKTTPDGRWGVQREINRRIKRRFGELGIEIPFPVQTILLGDRASPGGRPEEAQDAGEASHADPSPTGERRP